MTEPKSHVLSLQAQCTQTISSNLIRNFANLLKAEAVKNGGSVSPDLIESTANSFIQQSGGVPVPAALCERVKEDVYWDTRRRDPFDRLIVHRFFHLLSDSIADLGEEPQTALSRQLISGFIVALSRTIGLELYEQSQFKTQRLLTTHLEAPDGTPNWDEIYQNKEAIHLIDNVLIVFAQSFKKFEIRVGWTVEVVNSNLPPVNAAYPQNLWMLRSSGCCLLLDALYADLRDRIKANPLLIKGDYGEEADASLSAFFISLDRATQQNQTETALAV